MEYSHKNIVCEADIGIVISPLQRLFHSHSHSLQNEVLRDINTSIDTSLMALTQSSNLGGTSFRGTRNYFVINFKSVLDR